MSDMGGILSAIARERMGRYPTTTKEGRQWLTRLVLLKSPYYGRIIEATKSTQRAKGHFARGVPKKGKWVVR